MTARARAPVDVIKHKWSWFRVDVTDQYAMSCSISRQFSHLAAGSIRISVVQFLASSVNCQTVVHRCTSSSSSSSSSVVVFYSQWLLQANGYDISRTNMHANTLCPNWTDVESQISFKQLLLYLNATFTKVIALFNQQHLQHMFWDTNVEIYVP